MKNINSVITGTGSYLPEFVLDNKMLEQTVETYNDWIVSRTGIKERRMEQEKLTFEMIGEACKCALNNAGLTPDKIDMIIVSTITSDYSFPSTACLVQNYIQADNASSFDVAAACAGFIFVLDMADAYIKAGRAKNILIASGDVLTRTVNYFDRSNCILFGDGAGAAVVSASEEPERGVIASYTASECDGLKPFFIQAELYKPSQIFDKETKLFKGNVDKVRNSYITQNGREVMQFVTKVVPKALDEVLRRANKNMADLKYIILHQANKRIIDHVVDKCQIDREKVPLTIDKYGNTSSSTVPILLHELNEQNLIRRGDLIALAGFGSGLVYGAVLVKW
ncbi:MAG: ketoacyl-ACP synthase III [Oscillospiraceae bacterium]|nr:ketoacyl-ACP synthase III [Oscillospiraceae bacterium]